jgi:hypothetical protein
MLCDIAKVCVLPCMEQRAALVHSGKHPICALAGAPAAALYAMHSCCLLQDPEQLAKRMAASAYVLDLEVVHDGNSTPRTVEIKARLYSAAATTRCLELHLTWHHRARWASVEWFNKAYVNIRWGGGAGCWWRVGGQINPVA